MSLSSLQITMLRRLLATGNEGMIAHGLEKIHPADIGQLFSDLTPHEIKGLINSLFLLEKAGKTILELPEFIIPDILADIDNTKLTKIIANQQPDDAIYLLEKISEERQKLILSQLPAQHSNRLQKLLLYPKGSAGSVMTSNFFRVEDTLTVEQAIDKIRSQPDVEGISYIYVTDERGCLLGTQSIRRLVTSPPGTQIKQLMNPNVRYVLATDTEERVAQLVSQYSLLAIPVVSENKELVGVITVDDVIDIFKQEATVDIYNLAGLSEDDRAITPLITKVKKRFPWLILNLLTAAMASSIIGLFQNSISQAVILAVFLPIVANVGGNVGLQSLTVISRSIALGELSYIRVYRAVFKEVGSAMVIGVVSGLLVGGTAYLWKGNPYLAGILTTAMLGTLMIGGVVGSTLPLLFRKMKLDPAVGTSVLVTMVTDILAFFFVLGLATNMMELIK